MRALVETRLPPIKEPAELLRTDGKRSYGLTITSVQAEKTSLWNVIVIDPFAESCLSSTSVSVLLPSERK